MPAMYQAVYMHNACKISFTHMNLVKKCNYYSHAIGEETEPWKGETSKGACASEGTELRVVGSGFEKISSAHTIIPLSKKRKGKGEARSMYVVEHIYKHFRPSCNVIVSLPTLGGWWKGKGSDPQQ